MKQQLPIGSVVMVKGSSQPLMIVSQFPVTTLDGQTGYFDFGAVTLPSGLTGKELIFFNKEDIERPVFVGYVDVTFQDLLQRYDELIADIPYPRLTVPERAGVTDEA